MEDGYLGEIRIFAGTFAPRNWAFCAGQTLAISSNEALFTIIGTTYGGDGRTTFMLPDLRARVVVGAGDARSTGLGVISEGARFGNETTQLSVANIPSHTHTAAVSGITATGVATVAIPASTVTATLSEPAANTILSLGEDSENQHEINAYGIETADTNLKPFPAPVAITVAGGTVTVNPTGNGTSFSNVQPSLGINYIICTDGLYPSRS